MSYRTTLSYSASYLASLSSSSSFAILFSSSSALFCRTFFIRSRNKKYIPIQFLSVYLLPYLSIFLSVYRYIIESYSIVSYYRCIIVSLCHRIIVSFYPSIFLCCLFIYVFFLLYLSRQRQWRPCRASGWRWAASPLSSQGLPQGPVRWINR